MSNLILSNTSEVVVSQETNTTNIKGDKMVEERKEGIEITLRELGTHNNGMNIDISFDLDNYTDSEEIIEELFSQTREYLEERNIKYFDEECFEEWIITDIEIDSEYLNIDNFFHQDMSLDLLIELNNLLQDKNENDIRLEILLDNGRTLTYSMDLIASGNVNLYLIGDMSFKSENKLLGEWLIYESEYFDDLPDKYKRYIDYEYFSKEYGQDMITKTFKNGRVYTLSSI